MKHRRAREALLKFFCPRPRILTGALKIVNNNEKTAQKPGEGLTILFLEDEESIRKAIRRILEKMGFRVLLAGTIKEAEKIFTKYRKTIDFLFFDVVLPDGNGIETAGKLKTLKNNLILVATSGYLADKVNREDIKEENIKFIEKPFDINTVRTVFAELSGEIKEE